MPQILKKISTKTAVSVNDFKKLEVKTAVLRIVGIVRDIEIGVHAQFGEFKKFKGNFQATDLRTGEVSVSSVAFLPAPVDEMLMDAFKAGEGSSVEFGFDISVSPRPDTPIGYEFTVSSLLEAKVSDPMASLMEKIQKNAQLGYTAPSDKTPASEAKKPATVSADDSEGVKAHSGTKSSKK